MSTTIFQVLEMLLTRSFHFRTLETGQTAMFPVFMLEKLGTLETIQQSAYH